MSSQLCIKRLTRERQRLQEPNSDYFVHFNDQNLLEFDVYIVGPEDSLYRHKFVKIHFTIPSNYPFQPPHCKFVQHSGGRIHPNLYTDGKVCLSILGTWPGEPWSQAMTIHTVLLTIRSLLDNEPFRHEPKQGDCPVFNDYVRYATWQSLLFDYINNEREPDCRKFLLGYAGTHGAHMLSELEKQERASKLKGLRKFQNRYDSKSEVKANYPQLMVQLTALIKLAGPGPVLEIAASVTPRSLPSAGPSQVIGASNRGLAEASAGVVDETSYPKSRRSLEKLRAAGSRLATAVRGAISGGGDPTDAPGVAAPTAGSSSAKRKREPEVIVID